MIQSQPLSSPRGRSNWQPATVPRARRRQITSPDSCGRRFWWRPDGTETIRLEAHHHSLIGDAALFKASAMEPRESQHEPRRKFEGPGHLRRARPRCGAHSVRDGRPRPSRQGTPSRDGARGCTSRPPGAEGATAAPTSPASTRRSGWSTGMKRRRLGPCGPVDGPTCLPWPGLRRR